MGMSWETGIREEMWRMVKKMAGCAESATVLDGEASKYLDVSRGSAKGCTLSLTLLKVLINDLIISMETAKQGVKVDE